MFKVIWGDCLTTIWDGANVSHAIYWLAVYSLRILTTREECNLTTKRSCSIQPNQMYSLRRERHTHTHTHNVQVLLWWCLPSGAQRSHPSQSLLSAQCTPAPRDRTWPSIPHTSHCTRLWLVPHTPSWHLRHPDHPTASEPALWPAQTLSSSLSQWELTQPADGLSTSPYTHRSSEATHTHLSRQHTTTAGHWTA